MCYGEMLVGEPFSCGFGAVMGFGHGVPPLESEGPCGHVRTSERRDYHVYHGFSLMRITAVPRRRGALDAAGRGTQKRSENVLRLTQCAGNGGRWSTGWWRDRLFGKIPHTTSMQAAHSQRKFETR